MGHYTQTLLVLVAVTIVKSQGLRVNSCSKTPANDIVKVNWANVHPSPIQVPGEMSLSVSVTLLQPITGNIEADITISKKFGSMWIDLPCVQTSNGRLGSCNYRSLCEVLQRSNGSCPRLLVNNKIPCSCPIQAGTYTIPQTSIPLDFKILGINLPIIGGEYQASIRLTNKDTMEKLVCYDVDVELTDPPSSNPFGSIGRFLVNLFG